MKTFFVLVLVLAARVCVAGPLQLGSGLQDGMVIQQNRPMTVWGWGKAGTLVSIQGDWMSDAVTVKVDASGAFSGIIAVPSVKAGDYKPHTLVVASFEEKVTLNNILIGEVWLCSGQSNMQFAMREVTDSTADVAAAHHPHLRLLDVALNFSATPIDTFRGKWVECSPETVRKFSAVGYYFGRELLNSLDVPVGIIFSGIGASAAQAYVPQPVLAADTMLDRVYLEPYLKSERSKEVINGGFSFEKVTRPFLLYNAMINPLRRISLRGICWYQGESNRNERLSYTRLTQTMISSWRSMFGQGELPFYFVQVAPYFYDKEDPTLADFSYFREAQENVSELGNTAMVTTVDVGEPKNLHPHNKKPIGIRLAKTALNRVYGQLGVIYRGPQYSHLQIDGRKVTVVFQPGTVAGGLRTDDGGAVREFFVAGDDRKWYPAQAVISGDEVIVSSDKVKHPVAVRYAFTNYAIGHLFNGEGWPVVPFRTDKWEEVK